VGEDGGLTRAWMSAAVSDLDDKSVLGDAGCT
jgi:hypothetical protein